MSSQYVQKIYLDGAITSIARMKITLFYETNTYHTIPPAHDFKPVLSDDGGEMTWGVMHRPCNRCFTIFARVSINAISLMNLLFGRIHIGAWFAFTLLPCCVSKILRNDVTGFIDTSCNNRYPFNIQCCADDTPVGPGSQATVRHITVKTRHLRGNTTQSGATACSWCITILHWRLQWIHELR